MFIITSVRDIVADNYLGLQLCGNDKVAVRGFIDAVSDIAQSDESLLVKHPEDFELWKLGEFDQETGEIIVIQERLLSGRLALRMFRGLDSDLEGDFDDVAEEL